MQVILFSKLCGQSGSIEFCLPRLLAALLVGGAVAVGLAAWAGYQYGLTDLRQASHEAIEPLHEELFAQRDAVNETQRMAQEHLNALAQRMGSLQASMYRLDALGQRLVDLGKLDSDEFDFDASPAVGGAEDALAAVQSESVSSDEILAELAQLSVVMDERSRALRALETVLLSRELSDEVVPAGKPINKGWISSYFGRRPDPFTGKKAWHKGIDFASPEGSDVLAVGSGVVEDVVSKKGYGHQVVINHGNGYESRYAHNKEVLVEVGQTVHRGDVIAKVGSTGRSTGPHVHFEIIKDGKSVNPLKFVKKVVAAK